MNPLPAVLFLSFFGGGEPAACPAANPVIEVKAMFPGTTLDLSHPRSDLARQMKRTPYPGFFIQGLTLLDFGTTYKTTVSMSEIGPGRWCASIERIDAEFGLKEPAKVMIASEIEKDSCVYRSILDHEGLHVGIGERGATQGARDMQAAVAKAVAEAFPIEGDSKDQAYGLAKQVIERAVDESSSEAIARADRENMALDTKQSYEQLGGMCP